MKAHIATLAALLALLLIPATLLVDTRCFVALVACALVFGIAESGLPLPLPSSDITDNDNPVSERENTAIQ